MQPPTAVNQNHTQKFTRLRTGTSYVGAMPKVIRITAQPRGSHFCQHDLPERGNQAQTQDQPRPHLGRQRNPLQTNGSRNAAPGREQPSQGEDSEPTQRSPRYIRGSVLGCSRSLAIVDMAGRASSASTSEPVAWESGRVALSVPPAR